MRPEQETFAVSPVEPRVDEDGAGGNETGSDGNGTDEGDNRTAAVAGAATGIAPGETARYDVVVRNTGSEPVSDVQAKLFVDEPISSDDDEAFVTSLDPGEETTLRFEVSADGGPRRRRTPPRSTSGTTTPRATSSSRTPTGSPSRSPPTTVAACSGHRSESSPC